mmetsp:Transcript_36875/g.120568  ORF Transcript_36875/g.120568 Transcript_36875/m.120568 type:complete len:200 (-) Transcript_36875:21-620(-)
MGRPLRFAAITPPHPPRRRRLGLRRLRLRLRPVSPPRGGCCHLCSRAERAGGRLDRGAGQAHRSCQRGGAQRPARSRLPRRRGLLRLLARRRGGAAAWPLRRLHPSRVARGAAGRRGRLDHRRRAQARGHYRQGFRDIALHPPLLGPLRAAALAPILAQPALLARRRAGGRRDRGVLPQHRRALRYFGEKCNDERKRSN